MATMTYPEHRLHAARLTLEMAKRDITAEQLADLCGVSVRTVRNWTGGVAKPGVEAREVLIGLFGRYDD